jgi:hypothetical protein
MSLGAFLSSSTAGGANGLEHAVSAALLLLHSHAAAASMSGGAAATVVTAAAAAAPPAAAAASPHAPLGPDERDHYVHAAAAVLHSHGESCSRSRSRLARRIVSAQLSRLGGDGEHGGGGAGGAVTPADAHGCPFHPASDMFAAQERHKQKQARRRWKCGYCGKVFVSEAYLDRHMGLRHGSAVPLNATTCLADFCGVLGCEGGVGGGGGDGGGGGSGVGAGAAAVAGCAVDAQGVDRLRFKCKAAMLRCFPPARGAAWARAQATADARWCEPLRCRAGGAVGAVGAGVVGQSQEWAAETATAADSEWAALLALSASWVGWLGIAATAAFYWALGQYGCDVRMRPDLRPGLLSKRRR